MSAPKKTPLHECHAAAGARFVEFAGYEMPVQYADGILAEHAHVREKVGLFDVSHMGEVFVEGPDAIPAVDRLVTNDLAGLADGQAMYTAMCLPSGGIVDDLVIYRFSPEKVLIVCNASNRQKDFDWIVEHLEGDAEATDRGDDYAQLAVQGPLAEALLQPLASRELHGLRRYWFSEGEVAGVPAIIARTGYTGEDGFELYVPAARGAELWDALFHAGQGVLAPIGLGARDTLRLEMKYALYGNDIDESTTPLEAGLGWICKLDKPGGFIGQAALSAQKKDGVPRRLVAFRMDGRGAPARPGYDVVDADGQPIGRVTSGTRSPTLGVNIGLAYVPDGQHKIGRPLRIAVRNKVVDATIVKPPFVKKTA